MFPTADADWFQGGGGCHFSKGARSSHVTNPRLGLDSLNINGGEVWSGDPSYPSNYPSEYNVAAGFPPSIRVPERRPPPSIGGGPPSPFSPPWSSPHPARSGPASQPTYGDIGRAFSPPRPPRHPSWLTPPRPASTSPPYRRGTARTQRGGRPHQATADGDVLLVYLRPSTFFVTNSYYLCFQLMS